MTPKQDRWYWQLWSTAAKAQRWTTCLGLTSADISAIRHQQHLECLGYAKSHKDFTNAEFDRIKAHFQLLADETNIAAHIALDNPDQGERKRLIYRITKLAPEAYRNKIALDKFGKDALDKSGYPTLEKLTLNQLTQLRDTLVARAAAFRKQKPKTDNPF